MGAAVVEKLEHLDLALGFSGLGRIDYLESASLGTSGQTKAAEGGKGGQLLEDITTLH
jgi:hypothetical protein